MATELHYTQNFLKSRKLVEKIVQIAAIERGMTVLEVGPGKGIITRELAKRVGMTGRVVAVELDGRLSAEIRQKFQSTPQIEIVNQDILQFNLSTLSQPYHIVSNIPFNITSDLLSHLLNLTTGATSAHLILQRDTLIGTNKVGAETETFKSLLIKPLYEIAAVHTFVRSDFSPQPSVETALFAFKRRAEGLVSAEKYPLYADFLAFISKDRVGEGAWRKLFSKRQLAQLTNLQHGRGLKSQSLTGILAAFDQLPTAKQPVITGAMHQLRTEQQRREKINRAGGHHRSKRSNQRRRR